LGKHTLLFESIFYLEARGKLVLFW